MRKLFKYFKQWENKLPNDFKLYPEIHLCSDQSGHIADVDGKVICEFGSIKELINFFKES